IGLREMAKRAVPDHGIIGVGWKGLGHGVALHVVDLRMSVVTPGVHNRAVFDVNGVDLPGPIRVEPAREKAVAAADVEHMISVGKGIAGHRGTVERVRRGRRVSETKSKDTTSKVIEM